MRSTIDSSRGHLIGGWILALLVLSNPSGGWTTELDVGRTLEQFEFQMKQYERLEGNRSLAEPALVSAFHALLGWHFDRLDAVDDDTLGRLYTATHTVVYYTHDRAASELLPRLSLALSERGPEVDPIRGNPVNGNHGQATYDALINARLFTLAHQFWSRQGHGVSPFAGVVDEDAMAAVERGDAPAVFRIDVEDHAPRLVGDLVDVGQGDWFVAVVHPWCGFSKAAMDILDVDEEFRGLSPDNTLWFIGQGDTARIAPIVEWNRQSNVIDMALAYRDADWADLIDLSETPQFYLIRDGDVLRHIKGWPDDSRLQLLKDYLREAFGAGMEEQTTCPDVPSVSDGD